MTNDAGRIPHRRVRAVAEDLIVLDGGELSGADIIAVFAKTGAIAPGLRDAIAFVIAGQGITLDNSLDAISDLMRYVEYYGIREAMPGGDKWDLRPLG